MRNYRICACAAVLLACVAFAEQPAAKAKAGSEKSPVPGSGQPELKDMLEAKVKAEWDALKIKDKKTYGDLLAEDYEGVEVDGQGERTKIQAINEVADGNVYHYTLWGLKVTPLGPDAAFVVYEVTVQFPPKAQVRYSRVYIGELWVKRDEQWKELHYQETHVR